MFRKHKCQACNRSSKLNSIPGGEDIVFNLCSDCSKRLEEQTLRPIEWYNLAARFGSITPLLHYGYDRDGIADNLDKPVLLDVKYLSPKLQDVSHSCSKTIDYCMTRGFLTSEEFNVLDKFPKQQLLEQVVSLAKRRTTFAISKSFVIAANVLKNTAEAFISSKFDEAIRHDLIIDYSKAAASCLPFEDGFSKIQSAISNHDRPYDNLIALAFFQSSETLLWIENNIPESNISDKWGLLAAASKISQNKIETWLSRGRPLSLVGLDALRDLIPAQNRGNLIRDLKSSLNGEVDIKALKEVITNYARKDDSHRVKTRCEYILNNIDNIRIAKVPFQGFCCILPLKSNVRYALTANIMARLRTMPNYLML